MSQTSRPGNDRHFAGFEASEEGSMTILALFLFLCMVLIGGISIDLMLFENNRTRLQNLSDRAALAAADLDQTLDPEQVVQSYFEKEGMDQYLTDVQAVSNFNSRSVVISTEKVQDTMFLNFWNHTGIDTLTPRTVSGAFESRSDIEISMVLDVSNSMNWPSTAPNAETKIDDLKQAAGRFIDTIYATDTPERITVSLIPYSTHVNVGPRIANALGVSLRHDDSYCLNFEEDDYEETTIRGNGEYRHAMHFDQWYYDLTPQLFVCRPNPENVVLPLQGDPDRIKQYINGLTAHGNTSTEIGVKWGAAFLDPSSRSVVQEFVNDGVVDNQHDDRPYAYGEENTLKFMVVLTDGINTEQATMNDAFATGPSRVWKWVPNPAVPVAFYSVYAPEYDRYYTTGFVLRRQVTGLWYDINVPRGWYNQPIGADLGLLNFRLPGALNNAVTPVRMDYSNLWGEMSVHHYAYYFIRAMYNSNHAMNTFLNQVWTPIDGPQKDTRLLSMCDEARDNDIVVFTIGFEVDDHAADIMSRCATTPNYFIRVVGNDLEAAFNQIANSISRLRLTQ